MARYGLDLYGNNYYGVDPGTGGLSIFSPGPGGFRGRMSAGTDYGTVDLSWNQPGGDYTAFRIVRNFYNFPSDAYDGAILVDDAASIPVPVPWHSGFTGVRDTGLPEGSFVYYSMFVFVAGSINEWVRAADLMLLIDKDWGYNDLLWERIPEFYRAWDADLVDPQIDATLEAGAGSALAGQGPLQRFLGLFGMEFDHIRTEYETLRLANNVRRMSGGLLPLIANELGISYEAEIGMRQNRSYIENAVHFYKLKGTRLGVEGIATAVTGWDNTTYLGPNLMLTQEDAFFGTPTAGSTTPPGSWRQTSGTPSTFSLTSCATEGIGAPTDPIYGPVTFGDSILKIVGTGTTGSNADLLGGDIPVPAGATNATFAVEEAASVSGAPWQMSLAFLDGQRNVISATVLPLTTVTPATAAWNLAAIHVSIPGSCRFIQPGITYRNTSGLINYFAFGQVTFTSTTQPYEHPRTVHIKLRADRVNLVPQSNNVPTTNNFSLTGVNCTLSNHSIGGGAFEGQATSTAAGQVRFHTVLMPVVEGLSYAASMYLRPGSTLQAVDLTIAWFQSDGVTLISTSTGDMVNEVAYPDYVRPSVVAQAPGGAVWAYILVRIWTTNAAGEIHYFWRPLFEKASSVKPYFDGSMPSSTADYLWENADVNGPSDFYYRRTIKRFRLISILSDYLPASTPYTLEFAKNP